LFQLESELDDDRLRLAPVDQGEFTAGEQLFALPLIDDDETGAYYDFIDAISAAHIRKLNATHDYVRDCTELEMQEELDALDRDRYVAAENIHCFDAINRDSSMETRRMGRIRLLTLFAVAIGSTAVSAADWSALEQYQRNNLAPGL